MLQRTVTAITDDPIRQLIKLNCLLKNFIHSYRFLDTIHLFQQIHSSHSLKPDQYTISTTLTACANLHDATVGSQVHAYSIISGLKIFPHVMNSLLSLYAKSQDLFSVKRVFDEIKKPDIYSFTTFISALTKLGEVDYACSVLDEMPQQDLPVWNAIITGCAESGHDGIAFDVFYKMHVLGTKADNYTYASILSICSLEQFDFGRQVHGLVFRTGFLARASVLNSLISMYFNCKSDADAYGLFEEVGCEVGDEITYNSVISGLANMEKYEEALLTFKDMQTVGLKPTELTFVSVMGASLCSRAAVQIHCKAVKAGFEDSTSVSNAAISMYSNCGNLMDACLIFRRLKEKDIVSWNAIIAGYAQENMGSESVFSYLEMQRNGIQPDEFTIGSLLSSSESLVVVEMILAMVIKTALIMGAEVSNALLSAFSKFGEINQAYKLFCDTHPKNLISWNAMISGFQLNGLPSHGLKLFSIFLQCGLIPNHYTLSLVLSICANISDLRRGKEVHAYILKLGYFRHLLLGNALIAFYAKSGALSCSSRVFHNMTEKDIVSWNSIISAFAQHGEGEEAIQCFKDLQCSSGIRPDNATCTAILSACSRSGLVSDGLRIFNSMVNDYGIKPETHHFSCIVDLLGRAGFLDMAERMINDNKTDVGSDVWWTLFSLCAAHGRLELGNIVAGFLLETENNDPGVYVLLSNLYANAGKWEESANVRELMKKYGVMKQPGGSWITA